MSSNPYARRPDLPLPISISTIPTSRTPLRSGLVRLLRRSAGRTPFSSDLYGNQSIGRGSGAVVTATGPANNGAEYRAPARSADGRYKGPVKRRQVPLGPAPAELPSSQEN